LSIDVLNPIEETMKVDLNQADDVIRVFSAIETPAVAMASDPVREQIDRGIDPVLLRMLPKQDSKGAQMTEVAQEDHNKDNKDNKEDIRRAFDVTLAEAIIASRIVLPLPLKTEDGSTMNEDLQLLTGNQQQQIMQQDSLFSTWFKVGLKIEEWFCALLENLESR